MKGIIETNLTMILGNHNSENSFNAKEEDEVISKKRHLKSGCKQTRKFPTVKQKIEAVKCCIEICKGNKIEAWAYFADHPV